MICVVATNIRDIMCKGRDGKVLKYGVLKKGVLQYLYFWCFFRTVKLKAVNV